MTFNQILAFSGFFEVLEAIIAELVSPELGNAYLGTQGDGRDTQKEMGLALLGSIIAMGLNTWHESRSAAERP